MLVSGRVHNFECWICWVCKTKQKTGLRGNVGYDMILEFKSWNTPSKWDANEKGVLGLTLIHWMSTSRATDSLKLTVRPQKIRQKPKRKRERVFQSHPLEGGDVVVGFTGGCRWFNSWRLLRVGHGANEALKKIWIFKKGSFSTWLAPGKSDLFGYYKFRCIFGTVAEDIISPQM